MDSYGETSAEFDFDVLNQSDKDLLVEKKKASFLSFSSSSDARRSVELSDSPSPDLVQDAYDRDEDVKAQLFDFDAITSCVKQLNSSGTFNKESDDRPVTLPDILKSFPLNPDKMDSGSSEGSPDLSPVHKNGNDSLNSLSSVSASNPFGFDSKILLLKEMADETEARAVEKAKLDEEMISEQHFVAFDLVKETKAPLKNNRLLKDQERYQTSSQTCFQVNDKFECLNFLSEKVEERSDSKSPTADSFSPVLDVKKTSSFSLEREIVAVREEIEAIDEVSEQEISSEEFEFVERPPRGDEFMEIQGHSNTEETIPDEEQSPDSLELPLQMLSTQEDQSSYHFISQISDDSCAVREKESPEEISLASLIQTHLDKNKTEKIESDVISTSSLKSSTVVELLYWRNVRWSAMVFGLSLILLVSTSICSIISVISHVSLAFISITLSFRIYKGILQAIQKSDDGHPFKQYLEKDMSLSEDLVEKYSVMILNQINAGLIELRRLFLVEDLVDSLKLAVFLWILTYVGAVFNGVTLLILGLVGAFSCPVIYEKHQTEFDQYISILKNQIKDAFEKIQAKVPGMKKLE